MMALALRLAEECPAVEIEWDEDAKRQHKDWWDGLTAEEQERARDGMIAT